MSKEEISLVARSHALLAVLFCLLLSACAVQKEYVSDGDLDRNHNLSDVGAHDYIAWHVADGHKGPEAYNKWAKGWFSAIGTIPILNDNGNVLTIVSPRDGLMHIAGRVHRPQVVSYLDQHGKLVDKTIRARRMESALHAALAPLQGEAPELLIYYNSIDSEKKKAEALLPFINALLTVLPAWDLFNEKHNADMSEFLASVDKYEPLSSVMPAIMSAIYTGTATLTVSLHGDENASLVLVTPPPMDERDRCLDPAAVLAGVVCRDLKESIDAETEQE
jgi:hypothetical protein